MGVRKAQSLVQCDEDPLASNERKDGKQSAERQGGYGIEKMGFSGEGRQDADADEKAEACVRLNVCN